MRRLIALPVVAAMAVATLTACSGKQGAGAPATASVATFTAATLTSSTPSAKQSPAPDLNTQLLKIQELPTGWAVDNSSSSDSTVKGCDAISNIQKQKSDGKADARFAKGGSLPQFTESLGYFADKAKADSSYSAGVAALNSCKKLIVDSDGKSITLTFGQMSLPSLGDRSQAYACTGELQGFSFGFYVDVVQAGNELVLTSYADLGTPDVTQFQTLRDKAIAKIT